MSLLDCDANCKNCLTYFTPSGQKVLKCEPSDANVAILISVFLLTILLIVSICTLKFLLYLKEKKQSHLEKTSKEERIRSDSIHVKSRRIKNFIKRKKGRLNVMDLNRPSGFKNKNISARTKGSVNFSKNLKEPESPKNFNKNKYLNLPMINRVSKVEI